MPQIITILLTIIAPIIVVAGLAGVLDRTKIIETRTISQIVIYLTSPALAFYGLANASIKAGELGALIAFSFLSTLSITLLAWLITRLFKLDRLSSSAFILSIALINVANYGIPVNEFAFGKAGLERAVVMGALGAIYANTLGIFVASSGQASLSHAFLNVVKVPLPYAAIIGLMFNLNQWLVPNFVLKVTGLLAGAAVPLMLIMLGIQISRVTWQGQWRLILGASGVRLLGGAILGLFWSSLLGLPGATHQVAVLEAAMPTAVYAGLLAAEFGSDAKLASSIIFASTLLSLITLPFVIYILL